LRTAAGWKPALQDKGGGKPALQEKVAERFSESCVFVPRARLISPSLQECCRKLAPALRS